MNASYQQIFSEKFDFKFEYSDWIQIQIRPISQYGSGSEQNARIQIRLKHQNPDPKSKGDL